MRETFAIAVGLLPSPEVFAILFVFMLVVWTIGWLVKISGGESELSAEDQEMDDLMERIDEEEREQKKIKNRLRKIRLRKELEEKEQEEMGSRLRTCPDCCGKVSKQATMCPQCGCPLVPSA